MCPDSQIPGDPPRVLAKGLPSEQRRWQQRRAAGSPRSGR